MPSPESENELGRDVDDAMRMFERSRVGASAALVPIRPSRVLLVLDGSPQDAASIAAASTLREHFNTETLVLDARDRTRLIEGQDLDSVPVDLAPESAAEISGARPVARIDGEPHHAIRQTAETHDVDLIVVPCPFGRDFESIGSDSVGSVIDVMLSHSPAPLLITRRDDMRLAECRRRVAIVIGSECDVGPKAARWAIGLSDESAELTLNLVVEHEAYENMRSMIEAIDEDIELDKAKFGDALTKSHHDLHATLAKTIAETSRRYSLKCQAGEVAPPNPLADDQSMLLVMPLEVDDRFTLGFVQDRIRRSPHPVLVVPGHVQAG